MKKDKLMLARKEYTRWQNKREAAIRVLVKSADRLPALARQIERLQRAKAKREEEALAPPDPMLNDPLPDPTTQLGMLGPAPGFDTKGNRVDDGLDIPPELDRSRKLAALPDPRSKEKKDQRKAVEKQHREADLTGKRRKMPLTGKAAMQAILGK
jgi:hypothetical protein